MRKLTQKLNSFGQTGDAFGSQEVSGAISEFVYIGNYLVQNATTIETFTTSFKDFCRKVENLTLLLKPTAS